VVAGQEAAEQLVVEVLGQECLAQALLKVCVRFGGQDTLTLVHTRCSLMSGGHAS
jgi:hypothetical protein